MNNASKSTERTSFIDFLKGSSKITENDEFFYKDGVYISLRLSKDSEQKVKEYQKKYLSGRVINNDLHVTLIYSKKPQKTEIKPENYTCDVKFKSFALYGPDKNTLVAELNSECLLKRNEELIEKYGFISDFDEYKPHLTLSYDIEYIDFDLPAFDFDIELTDETVEELDENWSSN